MQFTLRSVFLAFVVIGAALGAFGPWGLVVGIVIVAGAAAVKPQRPTKAEWLVILVILVILAALLLPDVDGSRGSFRRAQCMYNLKQIALALCSYHDKYGSPPPAFVPGPDGKPWHSWRVLILPYIEQTPLYEAYDFSEPWDGPNNSKLAASMPSIYWCPSANASPRPPQMANYVAVVGPRTMWPGAAPRRFEEVTDGLSNTILVVEAAPAGIPWMEPRDLAFEELAAPGKRDPAKDPLGGHRYEETGWLVVRDAVSGAHVAMADGRVRVISGSPPGEQLAGLLTVDGGEAADIDDLAWLPGRRRTHWPRVFSLLLLVVSTVLFWFSVRRPAKEDNDVRAGAFP